MNKRKRQKIRRTTTNQRLFGRKRSERRKQAFGILLKAALALLVVLGVTLYMNTRLRMPSGAQVSLIRQADGTIVMTWPEARDADGYSVRVVNEGNVLIDQQLTEHQCILPGADSGELKVSVRPLKRSTVLPMLAQKGKALSGTCTVAWPELLSFRTEGGADASTVSFIWGGGQNDAASYAYYLYSISSSGIYEQVARVEGLRQNISFGTGRDYPLPPKGESYAFVGCCGYEFGRIVLCSEPIGPYTYDRTAFLGSDIELEYEELGDNVYAFSWNETRGNEYLLQYQSDLVTEWTTIVAVDSAAEHTCTVRLQSGTNYRLRMVAANVSAGNVGEVEYVAQSPEITLTTDTSVTYATIWPQQTLNVYSTTGRGTVIGQAAAATAYCVLNEVDGMFYIHTANGYGYVDSGLCMINLPDYIGELCCYDIANSYSAIYKIHEYPIPEVTGTVITGYEDVLVSQEGSRNEYLVPLLYPTAQKLAAAARASLEDGYRIKIYDAYRPGDASSYLYRTTSKYLYDPVPEASGTQATATGVSTRSSSAGVAVMAVAAPVVADKLTIGIGQPALALMLEEENGLEDDAALGDLLETAPAEPAPTEIAPAETAAAEAPAAEPAPAETPQTEAAAAAPAQETVQTPAVDREADDTVDETMTRSGVPTYYFVMTNGTYHLGSFLARSGSTHNQGVAVDITLVDTYTGKELTMQTAMHDLSHYAVLNNNNGSANLLAKYMVDAGFGTLTTEWWHFQDNVTRARGIIYQSKGVSPEGWVMDDTGWRYRQEDGSFVKGTAKTILQTTYQFDEQGYAEVGW